MIKEVRAKLASVSGYRCILAEDFTIPDDIYLILRYIGSSIENAKHGAIDFDVILRGVGSNDNFVEKFIKADLKITSSCVTLYDYNINIANYVSGTSITISDSDYTFSEYFLMNTPEEVTMESKENNCFIIEKKYRLKLSFTKK